MKKREIIIPGKINNSGGLVMYMQELNEFLKQFKNEKVIVKVSVLPSKDQSKLLRAYYYNYVVPTFKAAIWESGERLTDEQTEKRLREFSPVMYEQTPDINTGKYETRLRTIAELSNAELIEHIEFLKQLASEEYNTFIDDPRSI